MLKIKHCVLGNIEQWTAMLKIEHCAPGNIEQRTVNHQLLQNSLVNNLHTRNHILRKMMMMMKCFCDVVTDERRLALLPVGTIVRDSHHRESPRRCEQGLNLQKTWVQA